MLAAGQGSGVGGWARWFSCIHGRMSSGLSGGSLGSPGLACLPSFLLSEASEQHTAAVHCGPLTSCTVCTVLAVTNSSMSPIFCCISPAQASLRGRPTDRTCGLRFGCMSGRLKGDLKRRALLLRSRSIPPSRSMPTAVHGCWGAAGTEVHGSCTVQAVRGRLYVNCQRPSADAGASGEGTMTTARAHSQPVRSSVSVFHRLPSASLLPSFSLALLPMYVTIASRLAISSRTGPTKKEARFKGHWPG